MKNSVLLLILLSVFISCTKDKIPQLDSDSTISINETGLENRITYFWDKIKPFPKSANDAITFYHLADVSSPIVNGEVCSATGIEIVGNRCYVTYHIAGAVYGGAIEVFDITSPANPILVSQVILTDTDFNECTISNGKLYAVGGRDVYSSDFTINNTKGGILLEIALTNEGLLTSNIRWGVLPSYSGNSVNVAGDYLFVASGSTGGGIFTLNKSDLTLVQSDYFDNAKFCDIKNNELGNKMIALQGYPEANLHEYAAGPNNVAGKTVHNILSQNVPHNGKAVVHIDNNDVYVCTGANGLMGFHTNALTTPFLEFHSPADGNANGVDTDNDFIYIANGLEGLIIVNKDDMTIHTIFEYNGSANYVQASGKYIFVANGKGGLKIISRVDPEPVVPVLPEVNLCGKNLTACAGRTVLTPEVYNGSYNVNGGQTVSVAAGSSGQNTFGHFNNSGTFKYCGNLVVNNTVNFNSASYTEIIGGLRAKSFNSNSCSYIGGQLNVTKHANFNSGSSTQIVNGFLAESSNVNSSSTIQIDGGGANIIENFNMNSNANVTLKGNLVVGGNYILETNATLVINGNITINGNFTFRGRIQIIGNSTITINGQVTLGNNRSITGTYTSNRTL